MCIRDSRAQRLVVGPAQRAVGQRAHGFARGADAGVQREAAAGRPAQAQAGLAAFAAAGVAVFALQAFGVELQVIGQLEAAPGVELATPTVQRRGRVVEEWR